MIRRTRRQFLEHASAVSAWFPFRKFALKTTAGLFPSKPDSEAQPRHNGGRRPTQVFDGSSLQGWHSLGSAKWSVENSQIVGSGGDGWLVLDRSLEDFVLAFSFRLGGGGTGVLLRNAPVNWSRYSHTAVPSSQTAGIYAALFGVHSGEMFRITLDAQGKELDREPLPGPAQNPSARSDKLSKSACGPIPCDGINDAEAAVHGYPAAPPVRISSQANGWRHVEVTLRGAALPWATAGVGAAVDQNSHFGQLALHVSGGPNAAVYFKDVSVIDLTQRVSGVAKNSSTAEFRQLSDLFYTEGVTAGDLNRDGYDEVVAGPFYYIGPDFRQAREIYPPTTINPGGPEELGNYSNCFLSYTHDFTGDGWPDVLMVMGFGPKPSFSGHLFLNPRGEARHWDNYNVIPVISSETAVLTDIDGDGNPELVMSQGDRIGYAKPDSADPTKAWTFHPVSEKGSWGPHGFGVGDVNADGRPEIVQATGWWERSGSEINALWTFHAAPFGATEGEYFLRGGSDIFVYDVNGDGLADVITALNAHGPGLAWFEQQRDGQGNVSWKLHLIMGDPETPMADRGDWEETDKSVAFTELHALAMADLDGDGGIDIITGKRWWSHGYRYEENDVDNPPVLYRFKLVRKSGGGVEWAPKLIDNGSGLGTQIIARDINKDGKPEIVTSARKGTFVFYNQSGKH